MQLSTLDELHVLSKQLLQETAEMPREEKKKHICDAVLDLLIMAYVFGSNRVVEGLTEEQYTLLSATDFDMEGTNISQQELYEVIYKPIADETFDERIRRRIDEETLNEETLNRIIETDYHRVEETGADKTARTISAKTGLKAYKRWETMQDDRVRDTHWYIQSVEVPIDELFYTFDHDAALFPGDFTFADNNVNCRCWLSYRFR